ncbi:polysaccharide biosynthesis protein [Haladaptatus paucihalophilus DX253]|uniref:Membrane protein involved in the export of O-antigen and teichoic acid n=1 Tax=Haladaptatus paucihalophilus DX253 TaxID=797209 RepID=E7QZN8_HALPU|nr:oligosaccharide flippase family protein [Haladaptatus paucihalophilus]EFW90159.1 polysaccharide biosynthesis protein [Haladaptatus paucihalophilus DX253]SHL07293.1 Membrane protein involved in the export of O-antigen and teichoic acid [Haladaptatus paucihalophilus DX253]
MKNNIAKFASIAFVGGIVGRGLRYAINVVIAQGLGTDALGLFAFGMVVMKAGSIPARLGLDTAVQKFIPIYRNDEETSKVSGTALLGLVTPLVIGSGLSLLLYFNRAAISAFTGNRFGSAIQLFIVGIPLFSTMMVASNATKGLKETKYFVYTRDIGQSSVAFLLVAVGAFVLNDLRLTILGYVVSLGVGVLLAVFFLLRRGVISLDVRPQFEFTEIFLVSMPLTVALVTQYLVSWTDILMLGFFVSPARVGWYQAAYQTSMLLLVVLQAASSIFPSLAADLYHNGKKDRLEMVYTVVTKWVSFFTVLGLIFLATYAGPVLQIFGTSTESARLALVILAFGQTTAAMVGPSGYLLIMSGYEKLQMINSVAVCAMNIGLNFLLIRQFGIVGAAAATSSSIATLNVLRLVEVRYLLGIQPYSRRFWKGVIAILVSTIVLVGGRLMGIGSFLGTVLIGAVALGVFGVVVYLLGFENDKVLVEAID